MTATRIGKVDVPLHSEKIRETKPTIFANKPGVKAHSCKCERYLHDVSVQLCLPEAKTRTWQSFLLDEHSNRRAYLGPQWNLW